LGPSGVGKTELAKRLAEFLFGDIDAMIRVDMSEYLESHTVSRLVGSPPGYVGFGESGQLTEQVRRRPHSIVLFDEIEKAHPDVLNVLLQLLDDGRITDAQGRLVDFKNTVVIMTSNAGSELIQKEGSFGFNSEDEAHISYTHIKEKVLEEIKKKFRPEFINRVDELIVFKPLTKEELETITEIMINDVNLRLKDKGMEISLTKKAERFLVEKGFDPKMGARPLRRSIEDNIEDPLSEEILRGKFGYGSKIKADLDEDRLVFTAKAVKSSKGSGKSGTDREVALREK
jgi:ATP-dependent Clp protease ATP-binding subunit ClpC